MGAEDRGLCPTNNPDCRSHCPSEGQWLLQSGLLVGHSPLSSALCGSFLGVGSWVGRGRCTQEQPCLEQQKLACLASPGNSALACQTQAFASLSLEACRPSYWTYHLTSWKMRRNWRMKMRTFLTCLMRSPCSGIPCLTSFSPSCHPCQGRACHPYLLPWTSCRAFHPLTCPLAWGLLKTSLLKMMMRKKKT